MRTQEPEAHDHSRILARLEHGGGAARPPARQRQKRLGIGALTLLSLAGLLAWLVYRSAIAPQPDQAQPALAAADRADPAGPADSVAQQTPPEAAPATIVSDSALAPPHAPHAPRPPAHLAATAPPVAPAKAATAYRALPPPPVAAEFPRPASDSDVTLLTALVAHARQQNQEAAAASGAGPDLAQHTDRDSTATLLQRCEQPSAIETMLCRSRICAGRRDPDPACE